jgi:hypothetical protein
VQTLRVGHPQARRTRCRPRPPRRGRGRPGARAERHARRCAPPAYVATAARCSRSARP